jgi:hypothetical protein
MVMAHLGAQISSYGAYSFIRSIFVDRKPLATKTQFMPVGSIAGHDIHLAHLLGLGRM